MIYTSFFIENVALFGGYPTHDQVGELEKYGVVCFFNLTCKHERNTTEYNVKQHVNYPIQDHGVPKDIKSFTLFLHYLKKTICALKSGQKIYLHCRGGHGRSSLVIVCFLSMIFKIPFYQSMEMVKYYHSLRKNLSCKWRKKSLLNEKQLKFLKSFLGDFYLYSGLHCQTLECLNTHVISNGVLFNVLINTGCKKILGEGTLSALLTDLREYYYTRILSS